MKQFTIKTAVILNRDERIDVKDFLKLDKKIKGNLQNKKFTNSDKGNFFCKFRIRTQFLFKYSTSNNFFFIYFKLILLKLFLQNLSQPIQISIVTTYAYITTHIWNNAKNDNHHSIAKRQIVAHTKLYMRKSLEISRLVRTRCDDLAMREKREKMRITSTCVDIVGCHAIAQQ